MEEKRDYSYVAEPPKGKKLGSSNKRATPIVPKGDISKLSPHEKVIMNRVLERTKLPSAGWNALLEDLKNNETKNAICARFRIAPADLKQIKRYLGY